MIKGKEIENRGEGGREGKGVRERERGRYNKIVIVRKFD